jgi:hypothetical protein
LIPSMDNPNLMFFELVAKSSHLLSMCIHALESATCQTRPSMLLFL